MNLDTPAPGGESSPALSIFRKNLESTWLFGKRLSYSLKSVSSMFPVTPEAIDAIGDSEEEKIDALLFRFSSAFSMIQDHVFKSIAIVEGEDISESSRRDVSKLMEKLGAIRSSEEITTLSGLRNKVSHVYPDHPEKQSEILNGIFKNTDLILEVMREISEYVVRKALLEDPPVFALASPEDPFNRPGVS